jgi:hypothetical protein
VEFVPEPSGGAIAFWIGLGFATCARRSRRSRPH